MTRGGGLIYGAGFWVFWGGVWIGVRNGVERNENRVGYTLSISLGGGSPTLTHLRCVWGSPRSGDRYVGINKPNKAKALNSKFRAGGGGKEWVSINGLRSGKFYYSTKSSSDRGKLG